MTLNMPILQLICRS